MIEKEELKAKIKEFNDLKDNFSRNCFKNEKLEKEWELFFEKLENLSETLQGYGYNIKIQVNIRNGLGKLEPYYLILQPYELNKNKNLLLLGTWDEEYEKIKVYNSFYPKSPNNEIQIPNANSCCCQVLEFILVQILEKQDYILNTFETKIISDINTFINFRKKLDELSKKYQ